MWVASLAWVLAAVNARKEEDRWVEACVYSHGQHLVSSRQKQFEMNYLARDHKFSAQSFLNLDQASFSFALQSRFASSYPKS